jgi:hypothetical protein
MQSFSTDPTDPGTRIWRQAARPSSQFVSTLAIIAFCLYFVGRLVVLTPRASPGIPWWLTAMILGAAVMGLFAAVTYGVAGWRTYRESREFAIRLTKKAIELTLPSPAFNGAVPIDGVSAIETRLELYSNFSAKWFVRTSRLVPRSGDPIFLFAERLPADNPDGAQMTGVLEEMAGHAQVPLRDLGTVQSRAGVMGVWGARPAEWSAQGLNTAERKVTWARASRTAKLMPWIIFGLIAIRFVVRMFTDRS